MRSIPVDQSSLGPHVVRWLSLADLNFPDSGHQWDAVAPVPSGVVTDSGWVVFLRRQVVLIVPDEVHTYWHHQASEQGPNARAHRIEGSAWLASFDPRHLGACSHFVIDFEDHVVEVICEGLLLGSGVFDLVSAIDAHAALADAHFWRALQREKRGDREGAMADFERVARSEGAFFRASAREHLARLR